MLNYLNTGIVFQEIPDEVTLSINITGCPCRCPGCHSQYLWENIGEPLTPMVLDQFVANYHREITCICFMGGDADPKYVSQLAQYLHREHQHAVVRRDAQQHGLRGGSYAYLRARALIKLHKNTHFISLDKPTNL